MMHLELRDVTKSFGAVEVIKGIDLAMEPGEFTVFVGPSGCGKSTLLRLISGLDDPSGGQIVFDGKDVTNLAPSDRRIAMVFQSYALYPHMTVRQNMDFALRVHGASADEVSRRVTAAAESLQLGPYLDRKPSELSGGQKQRVAIGRAIVRDPKLFLFDEPLSNLDAELRVQMRLELAELHERLAVNMIYVTHDQVEAMTLADRIVILNAGRVAQAGTPRHLYTDPDDTFVAGFLGSPKMNFLGGVVRNVARDSVSVTLMDAGAVELVFPQTSSVLKPGDEIIVGIRPEHFGPAGDCIVSVRLRLLEDLGGARFAYCRTEGGNLLTVAVGRTDGVPADAAFDVRFAREDALLFTKSGNRVR